MYVSPIALMIGLISEFGPESISTKAPRGASHLAAISPQPPYGPRRGTSASADNGRDVATAPAKNDATEYLIALPPLRRRALDLTAGRASSSAREQPNSQARS